MTDSSAIWREYYAKVIARPHLKRTEFSKGLNTSSLKVAIDCGCGVGADIAYLLQCGYQVHGFDHNTDAIEVCRERFNSDALVDISLDSFETYDYPKAGLVTANSSLFFADPQTFADAWQKIVECIDVGGVFSGDFLGDKDSWATNYRSPTTALTRDEVEQLFTQFEIVRFEERDEDALTARGYMKHWHVYSVVAIKR